MENKYEFIKQVAQSGLSDSDKVEYINQILIASDDEVMEGLNPEHIKAISSPKASCPPHIWNKINVPWKCYFCGLTPGQVEW